jgi:hypothetical protein
MLKLLKVFIYAHSKRTNPGSAPVRVPSQLRRPEAATLLVRSCRLGYQRFMKCRNPHNPQQRRARELLHSTIYGHSPQLCIVLLISTRTTCI